MAILCYVDGHKIECKNYIFGLGGTFIREEPYYDSRCYEVIKFYRYEGTLKSWPNLEQAEGYEIILE